MVAGTDQELFTRGELVAAFALEGISGGNAVFNPDKLDWFNQQHIMRLAAGDLARARAAAARRRPVSGASRSPAPSASGFCASSSC